MKITRFCFEPFVIDPRTLRKGYLIHLEAGDGSRTTVEASPLTGFSTETFEQVGAQLQTIEPHIRATCWSKLALKHAGHMGLFPSVHFALEMGILDLLECMGAPTELSGEEIPTYSLLLGTPEAIVRDAHALEQQGIRDVKVKLGTLSPTEAQAAIDPLIGRFLIRLDCNRKWPREQTLTFCSRYHPVPFLYIEEPCHNPAELFDFPYPFALDETLRDTDYHPLLQAPQLAQLILKPTLLYPLSPFLKSGIPCIVTSSFEGPIGIGQLRRCIKRIGLTHTLHGLDTLRHLEYTR